MASLARWRMPSLWLLGSSREAMTDQQHRAAPTCALFKLSAVADARRSISVHHNELQAGFSLQGAVGHWAIACPG